MQYSTKVMEHFANPRNVGEMADADGIGNVGNPVCGDIMRMYIKVEDGRIADAKFQTFGCGAAIATSSMATELVKGKTIDEALKVTNKAVAEALGGLPPVKMHCSVLAEEALHKAIDDYLKKTTGKGLDIKEHDELVAAHSHDADGVACEAPGEKDDVATA
ncbi:MAG: Fe-S cluster assembly scaffold protein NifU [Armatimonadota bacterium]|nr:MAG: Fe-S cluster assembly scaffold protein NifU [Armatimonadota bacterium]